MRLFISYARIDKPYCIQIVENLDVHETWYDQRLHAGKDWWKEILRRLDWCEGFIYLLSPDSISSEYCQKEFKLAQDLGRYIIPVLIHPDTEIPEALANIQYVDLSNGLNVEAVRALLNSIYMAEQERIHQPISPNGVTGDAIKMPGSDGPSAISMATEAMERGQFDHAVFLLKQARANGHKSRFIDLEALLAEAEAALKRQMYLREADREYQQILSLVRLERTRKLGCDAFHAFRKDYPDYDPENLSKLCAGQKTRNGFHQGKSSEPPAHHIVTNLPGFEWCDIPGGRIEIPNPARNGVGKSVQVIQVKPFLMARYPITNAQYQVFIDDPSGYANEQWWAFSPYAKAWRQHNPEAKPSKFKGDERPREMVNWYEAMAFCNWLSARTEGHITLPTDIQWMRAARGDEKRRFPWGDTFDKERCNTSESQIKMTTLVMRYENGISPYGVYDMAGNVWEWCLNSTPGTMTANEITTEKKRIVHGGAFISPGERAETTFQYTLDARNYHSSIGFRVIALRKG